MFKFNSKVRFFFLILVVASLIQLVHLSDAEDEYFYETVKGESGANENPDYCLALPPTAFFPYLWYSFKRIFGSDSCWTADRLSKPAQVIKNTVQIVPSKLQGMTVVITFSWSRHENGSLCRSFYLLDYKKSLDNGKDSLNWHTMGVILHGQTYVQRPINDEEQSLFDTEGILTAPYINQESSKNTEESEVFKSPYPGSICPIDLVPFNTDNNGVDSNYYLPFRLLRPQRAAYKPSSIGGTAATHGKRFPPPFCTVTLVFPSNYRLLVPKQDKME